MCIRDSLRCAPRSIPVQLRPAWCCFILPRLLMLAQRSSASWSCSQSASAWLPSWPSAWRLRASGP
eukprot:1572885-Prorocentrum_lima.AAC.1